MAVKEKPRTKADPLARKAATAAINACKKAIEAEGGDGEAFAQTCATHRDRINAALQKFLEREEILTA